MVRQVQPRFNWSKTLIGNFQLIFLMYCLKRKREKRKKEEKIDLHLNSFSLYVLTETIVYKFNSKWSTLYLCEKSLGIGKFREQSEELLSN